MSDDRADESDGGRRGFHLRVGLRALSDILGDLVEVEATRDPPPEPSVEWDDVADDELDTGTGRERTKRLRTSTTDRCLVDTRFDGGAFVVHADIPGAEVDDVSVGLDPRADQLVVGVHDEAVAWVDLPWSKAEATDVWFNNGVLEVRLRPTDA
ncbi:gas vesicle protein GvpH [Halovivax gelatinilyticus]|uniref:gas vesicle protein GvpH n=1 Tax=Halovivax gelatinilyticus TaxID=2961597 RepID=UPI0020CA3577|nr:gas vesicle protein GvpH [Halovivax gelatinilyticus]